MDVNALSPKSANVRGAPITYYEAGQGEATILLHGGGPGASGLSNYRRNVAALADAGRRVIVVDMPGFGASPNRAVETPGLYDHFAQYVLGLMDEIGVERASFIGNSLGGGTTLSLALERPERVDRMVLMGPGGSLALSPFPTEGLIRMLTFYDGDGPSMEKLERVIDMLVFDRSKITPELMKERYEACTRPDVMANPPLRGRGANPADDLWRRPLYQLRHPILVIWGREDRVLPVDAAFVLMKALPNAEMHIFPECGHWAQWEKADRFNGLVATFLNGQ
jgi:2-hydroxy-6-oxonona-2,4-dienedioate hydrolase/4,5:9,10-diseco-3-hydroxy-5,9,17-trioxoandrosta-1(10),2-diene-4-oate hydrolase